jgi:hypothetical protein
MSMENHPLSATYRNAPNKDKKKFPSFQYSSLLNIKLHILLNILLKQGSEVLKLFFKLCGHTSIQSLIHPPAT